MPNARTCRLNEREARRMAALSPFAEDRERFNRIAEEARERAEMHEAQHEQPMAKDASSTSEAQTQDPTADSSAKSSWLSRLAGWRA